MAISSGLNVRVYKGAKIHTDMTDEAMTDSGDGLRFRITNRAKRYWDDTHVFTVYDNGTPVAASGYTIEYPGGEVVFKTSKAGRTITVTGGYFVIDKTYLLSSTDFSMKVQLEDATLYGDTAARNYPTLLSAAFNEVGFHEDNTMFDRLGGKYIAVFSESGVYQAASIDSGRRFEFYARLASNKIQAGAKGLLRDTLALINEGNVYYRSD
jgi:hypothetical protein